MSKFSENGVAGLILAKGALSGIAESFSPEEIIGKKGTVLANLVPRKLFGVKSQRMIFMAESSEGKLVFINPDNLS
jgi:methionyl-tRNA synthetase